jgi:hypothetical protein
VARDCRPPATCSLAHARPPRITPIRGPSTLDGCESDRVRAGQNIANRAHLVLLWHSYSWRRSSAAAPVAAGSGLVLAVAALCRPAQEVLYAECGVGARRRAGADFVARYRISRQHRLEIPLFGLALALGGAGRWAYQARQ